MSKFLSATFACALLATASAPTALYAQSNSAQNEIIVTGKHQKLWDKGTKLEAKGLDDFAKAQKDLTQASRSVLDAKSKRDTAQAKVANASEDFRQLTASVPYFSGAADAAKWADKVNNAARSWAKNDNRQDDGQSDLSKAIKQQSNAQNTVEKAQSDIDKGRAMKAEAQQKSIAG